MINKRGVKRAVKYTSIGVGTFVFDLGLLFIFVDVFGMQPALAAGIAFLIAVSVNYVLSRYYVFRETQRGFNSGYFIFIGIVAVGFFFVTGLMYMAVEIFNLNYIYSRIGIAGFVGIFNYLSNLFLNFKVHKG